MNNLQVKITLLFLLVSLVPLAGVGGFSIRTAEEFIADMVSNQLESVADDKLSLLDRWLAERKSDLKVVAGSSILRSMDQAAISEYLGQVRVNYQVYRDFVVANPSGIPVFDDAEKLSSYAAEKWFVEAMAGKIYQSPVILEPGGRESVFRISSPVRGPDGRIKGAVRATVGTRAILSIVLKVSLGETGESYLVDGAGTFLAHQDPRKILAENISRSGSFEKIFSGAGPRAYYTDYRGVEVMGATRHVADTDWYLVVEQDRDEAMAGVARLRGYIHASIAISLSIVILLALSFAYYVSKPIRNLSAAARALERGEFDTGRLATDRKDEIGALSSAFAEMAGRLEARRVSLERRVDLTESELKAAGARLRLTEEAAARSERLAALGRLAAGVTHEIRTPLTSLKLFLQSVRDDVEISPESIEDYLIAMNQIVRIEGTINRFLDFARPREPVISTVAIGELLEDALQVVGPRALQQEIVVVKDIERALPAIGGDKKQLSDAMLNLMVNGLESMAKGGALTVSASLDADGPGGSGRSIRIEIADTGEGIDPKNMEKLFDPFFTTKASGTGLGLSIVNSTVIAHGGKIEVDSEIGKGTAFRIYLPIGDDRKPDG